MTATTRRPWISAAAAAAALLASTSALAEAAPGFGVAAAVRGDVAIHRAGAPGALGSGGAVNPGDRIVTGESAGLQLMLSDETVFTLGAGTDFTLVRYTYDPTSAEGEILAQVARGSYRVVTGRIGAAHPGSIRVEMPTGTVSLRGTIVAGDADGDGDTVVLLGPGAKRSSADKKGSFAFIPKGAAVQTAEDEILVYRAGYAVTVDPQGNVSEPFEMSGREFGQLVASLARGRGAGGDAGSDDDASEVSGEDATLDPELVASLDDPGAVDTEEVVALVDEDTGRTVLEGKGPLRNQAITELADLTDIAGLKGTFSETGLKMNDGGSFDFRFEFGTAQPGELDFVGFENIQTGAVAGGELSWDVAADGAPTFEKLELSDADGTLVAKNACVDTCTGSVTVQNAGQGAVAKFFSLELDTTDDTFKDRLVRPGGNNNFPQ